MQTRARIGITLVALAVAAGLALGFLPQAVPVDVAAVTRGPLVVAAEEEGKTRVRERFVVSAPIAGYARRIGLRAGDAVRAGQVLAAIEPARSSALDPRSRVQAEAQVRAAGAAAAAARENARAAAAQGDLARQELERTESLRRANFISAQALDRARSEFDRSQAARLAADHAASVARFELEVARAALARTAGVPGGKAAETVEVRAPVAARVLKVLHESEGAVPAGQALLEIGDPESLEAEIEVLSTHAVKMAPGTRVIFDRWGGETRLVGAVRIVEPAGFTKISALGVEEQRVRVIVDFTSPRDEWRRLGDGYRLEARFILWEGDAVLQAPSGALSRQGGGWAAFVVEGGRAKLRPVEIGQRAGLQTEIRSGLAVGETLVSHPDDRIRDGVRVKPRLGSEP
jgi:HlyD family secretion protein